MGKATWFFFNSWGFLYVSIILLNKGNFIFFYQEEEEDNYEFNQTESVSRSGFGLELEDLAVILV